MKIKVENIDFRDLYRFDFSGLHVNYDALKIFSREELIEIRNTLERLKDIKFIIKESDLWKFLTINIRNDLENLWINENAMKEFIDILNKIIIDKTMQQRKT